MKIAIATIQVPFIFGGAEYHALNLKVALEKKGHNVEIITLPFKNYPPEKIVEHILASRLIDISESCGIKIDLMIGLKFPAYYFKHPNKVTWILHQYREAYDLWNTQYSDLNLSSTGHKVREAIIKADNLYLNESRIIFANSDNVKNRLLKFNGIKSKTLYHPCPDADKYYCDKYDKFIIYPSRINEIKRQNLVIDAMKYIKSDIKLYLIGNPDNPAYLKSLKKVVKDEHLDDKVIFTQFVSDKEKRALYSRARAVIFPPYDEDYGYVTLEAFYSSKPVITCIDSGGPLEFVEDKVTGLICKPDPKDIAKAIDNIAENESFAINMGKNAYEKIHDMDISWDNVVKELTK